MGKTILHYAAKSARFEMLAKVKEWAEDTGVYNEMNVASCKGLTPAMYVLRGRHTTDERTEYRMRREMLELLLGKIDKQSAERRRRLRNALIEELGGTRHDPFQPSCVRQVEKGHIAFEARSTAIMHAARGGPVALKVMRDMLNELNHQTHCSLLEILDMSKDEDGTVSIHQGENKQAGHDEVVSAASGIVVSNIDERARGENLATCRDYTDAGRGNEAYICIGPEHKDNASDLELSPSAQEIDTIPSSDGSREDSINQAARVPRSVHSSHEASAHSSVETGSNGDTGGQDIQIPNVGREHHTYL